MVIYCVASGCKSLQDKRNCISFHIFPLKRPEVLDLWIKAVRREKWTPTKTSRLCGEHFLPSDYQNKPGCTAKILKLDAVPSIFSFPKQLSKEVPLPPQQVPSTFNVEIKVEPMDIDLPSTEPKTFVDKETQTKIDNTVTLLRRKVKALKQKLKRRELQLLNTKEPTTEIKKSVRNYNNLNVVLKNYNEDEHNPMIEDSSSSIDDEELTEAFDFVVQQNNKSRVNIKNYCEQVVPLYSDQEFQKHFRLKRTLVQELIKMFESAPEYRSFLTNSWVSITPTKHMLVFLWFAGHQTASFRNVADRFDLALSSLDKVITRVISFVINLRSKHIQFPSAEDKERTKTHYSLKSGLPNIIGKLLNFVVNQISPVIIYYAVACVDGSHIKIDTPSEKPTDYFNRKSFYSVILQAACDEECRFLDVFVGYPGYVHEAQVFTNSMLYKNLDKLCRKGEYILGDGAYPLLPNLMTPYRDNGRLDGIQKHFNKTLSTCRVSIERAFGLLKQRFRQLYHVKLRGISNICNFIMACCVLHNLSIGDNLKFDNEKYDDDQPETVPIVVTYASDKLTEQGNKLRNELSEVLLQKKQVISL